jgi:prolyl-tRNA editing enzyme YbaK/EbsC (Cys-tRNA(Pro) deacylase)
LFLWLSKGNAKGETESEIIAAQDQELQTKYLLTKLLKQKQVSNADRKQIDETVEHIMSACSILA